MITQIDSIIIVIVIAYILFLGYKKDVLPNILNDLFNNFLFRASVIVIIVLITIGNKKMGGPMIGVLLSIAYVITIHLLRDEREMFYLMDPQTPQQEEDIDESTMESRDAAFVKDSEESDQAAISQGKEIYEIGTYTGAPTSLPSGLGYNSIPSNLLRQATGISGYQKL